MKTLLTMKEAMNHCKMIGCVYPYGKESYYINSNLPGDGYWIECEDGEFYCLYVDFSKLPKAYNFYSETVCLLEEKQLIKNCINNMVENDDEVFSEYSEKVKQFNFI